MKAVIFREHGGTHKLSYEDFPEPMIGPEDVLVRVKACALNHLDIWTREGNPAYPLVLPHIVGSDVAGTVDQIGSHVEGFTAGQRVCVSPGLSCWRCNACLAGRDNFLAVPMAVIVGVPLYSNAVGVIPLAEAMLNKGVAIGTTLALMMSIAAISLPELLILRKVIRLPGLLLFVTILTIAITLVGWTFNLLS